MVGEFSQEIPQETHDPGKCTPPKEETPHMTDLSGWVNSYDKTDFSTFSLLYVVRSREGRRL